MRREFRGRRAIRESRGQPEPLDPRAYKVFRVSPDLRVCRDPRAIRASRARQDPRDRKVSRAFRGSKELRERRAPRVRREPQV